MLLLTVLIQVIGKLFREMFNVDHVLIEDGYVSKQNIYALRFGSIKLNNYRFICHMGVYAI